MTDDEMRQAESEAWAKVGYRVGHLVAELTDHGWTVDDWWDRANLTITLVIRRPGWAGDGPTIDQLVEP